MLGQFGIVFVFTVSEGRGVVVESRVEVTNGVTIIHVAIIFGSYGCFAYQPLLLVVSIQCVMQYSPFS